MVSWCHHQVRDVHIMLHVQVRLKMHAGQQKIPTTVANWSWHMGKESNGCNLWSGKCQFWVACLVFAFCYPLTCGPETLLHICTLHSQTWQKLARLQRHSHSLVGTLLQDGRKSTSNTASRHDLTGFELRFKHTEPVLTEIYWHSNGLFQDPLSSIH